MQILNQAKSEDTSFQLWTVCWGESYATHCDYSCWRFSLSMAVIWQHLYCTTQHETQTTMLQKHPVIDRHFRSSQIWRTPFSFEQCVEVEARPHMVTHSCWRFGSSMYKIWQHSHGNTQPATHVTYLLKHLALNADFESSQIWRYLFHLWTVCWGGSKATHGDSELLEIW